MRKRKATIYPFEALKHGESFVARCAAVERKALQNILSVSAATWHKHPDNFCRFAVKTVAGGVRVTRLA